MDACLHVNHEEYHVGLADGKLHLPVNLALEDVVRVFHKASRVNH